MSRNPQNRDPFPLNARPQGSLVAIGVYDLRSRKYRYDMHTVAEAREMAVSLLEAIKESEAHIKATRTPYDAVMTLAYDIAPQITWNAIRRERPEAKPETPPAEPAAEAYAADTGDSSMRRDIQQIARSLQNVAERVQRLEEKPTITSIDVYAKYLADQKSAGALRTDYDTGSTP